EIQYVGIELEQRLERDGKAQALGHALVLGPGGNSHEPSLSVIEAPAAVAGVDRRIGLDDADRSAARILLAKLRNGPRGLRPAEPVWIADCENFVADFRFGVADPFG